MVGVLDGALRRPGRLSIATAYDDYGVLACGTSPPGQEGGGPRRATAPKVPARRSSRDEFLAQATPICDSYSGYLADEGAAVDGSPDSVRAFILDVVVPTLRDEAIAFEQIGFPEGDEEALQEIVDAQNALADQYEQNPVVDDGTAGDELNALLTDFGLTSCVA